MGRRRPGENARACMPCSWPIDSLFRVLFPFLLLPTRGAGVRSMALVEEGSTGPDRAAGGRWAERTDRRTPPPAIVAVCGETGGWAVRAAEATRTASVHGRRLLLGP